MKTISKSSMAALYLATSLTFPVGLQAAEEERYPNVKAFGYMQYTARSGAATTGH